jgi:hypothetical protein
VAGAVLAFETPVGGYLTSRGALPRRLGRALLEACGNCGAVPAIAYLGVD